MSNCQTSSHSLSSSWFADFSIFNFLLQVCLYWLITFCCSYYWMSSSLPGLNHQSSISSRKELHKASSMCFSIFVFLKLLFPNCRWWGNHLQNVEWVRQQFPHVASFPVPSSSLIDVAVSFCSRRNWGCCAPPGDCGHLWHCTICFFAGLKLLLILQLQFLRTVV